MSGRIGMEAQLEFFSSLGVADGCGNQSWLLLRHFHYYGADERKG